MNVAQSLWASIQGDPIFMRRVNGWLTIFWIAMIPVALVTGWVTSVVFVSALSLWALVAGHWSAWQAARVEVAQEAEISKRAKEHPEKDVVDAIVPRNRRDSHEILKDSRGTRSRSQVKRAKGPPAHVLDQAQRVPSRRTLFESDRS